jgi:1,4-alpha-glucan branching enzyme
MDVDLGGRDAPMSIYEVHLGSWRAPQGHDRRRPPYRELAEELPSYSRDMGFTHVEFLPLVERGEAPSDFVALVDAWHDAGLGVFLDWVPACSSDDARAFPRFDEPQVADELLADALSWLDRCHADGLRIGAVSAMLYLDYGRAGGGWTPNQYGGRENLAAITFLRRLNAEVPARYPGAITIAEEATAWPMVTRAVDAGGLGFTYKWNLGWMHDTLHYMSHDPRHRRHHHGDLLFGLHYAFSESFILPLPHHEVADGKGSLLGRMPGDAWQRFANLRACYAFMFGHPGKKLLFMGSEFGHAHEWRHDESLEWQLLELPPHRGIQTLVRDLNNLYCSLPALHELDCDAAGFEWLVMHDADRSVYAWLRKGRSPAARCLVVVNFTPEVRRDYAVEVPLACDWREILNTDATVYGGSNAGNCGLAPVLGGAQHPELRLTLPPLGALFLVPET